MADFISFEHGGFEYQGRPLDGLSQLQLARRLMPIVKALGTSVFSDATGGGESGGEEPPPPVMDPDSVPDELFDAIADIPDDHVKYIINMCMSGLKRKEPNGGWADVWNSTGSRPMFRDIDNMVSIVMICVKVIRCNIGNFTQGGLSSLFR